MREGSGLRENSLTDQNDERGPTIQASWILVSILCFFNCEPITGNRDMQRGVSVPHRGVTLLIAICSDCNLKKCSSAGSVVDGVKRRLQKNRNFVTG